MSSKGIEEMSEEKVNLANMSERQAVLYFQNGGCDDAQSEEKANSLLDYHQYFLYKKEKSHSQIDKSKLAERTKILKQSLTQFQKINKNIYINRKKYGFNEDEAFRCSCIPKKFSQTEAKKIIQSGYANKKEEEMFGCGLNCLNKMVSWECVEGNCPCGASCRNRKFQNHEYAEVYPIKTEDRGYGLCAGTFMPKGTFVIQYIGEVYSTESEYGRKKIEEYKNNKCTYLMSLSNNEVIDPTTKGNLARFINHSCEPNCETRKWNVLGEVCIGIFTLRDIEQDEELTFNYGFNIFRTIYQKCLCGSKNCKGYLGIVENVNVNPEKVLSNGICGGCDNICKTNENLLVCENCKRVFHRQCAKKGKKYNKNFMCQFCYDKLRQGKKFPLDNQMQMQIERTMIIEEEPIYDDIYEVYDEELRKIRKNLSQLISCGARLFWDYQQQNAILGTRNTLEIKITGTSAQIENVKKMIVQLKELKYDSNEIVAKIKVPKIFVRKIIGHQSRNLNAYKTKFNVEIEFDLNLITDEIFPIQESTCIEIRGREASVKAVENEIKNYLYNLQVLTIFLIPTDYQFVKANICQLKTEMDPADVRLRKREFKGEKDLKHPFYFIPNNNKDLVIIGFEKEVEKGEKNIIDFLKRLNDLTWNYSISFLFPIYIHKQLNNFLSENKNIIKDKKLYFDVIEPEFLRRHLSVYIEGKWRDVIDIKEKLCQYLKYINVSDTFTTNHEKYNLFNFDQYVFNQEHKLITKSIKNYILEQNTQIKNWDYISVYIDDLKANKKKNENELIVSTSGRQKEDNIKLVESFTSTCDRDTKLNYLLIFSPGSYKNVFNLTQKQLASNLYDSLSEIYQKYKDIQNQESGSVNSENKEVTWGEQWGGNEFVTNDIGDNSSNNNTFTKSNKNNFEHQMKIDNNINISQREKDVEKYNEDKDKHLHNKNNTLSSFSQLISNIHNDKVEDIIMTNISHQQQIPNESRNISYTFSNISQMNINININNDTTVKNYNNIVDKEHNANVNVNANSNEIEDIQQYSDNNNKVMMKNGNNITDSEKKFLKRKIRRSQSRNSIDKKGEISSSREQHRHYHYQRDSKYHQPNYERKHHSSHHRRRGYYDNNYTRNYSPSNSSNSSSNNKKKFPSGYNYTIERGYNNNYQYGNTPMNSGFYGNNDYKQYQSNSSRGHNNNRIYEDGKFNRKGKNY